VTRVGARLQANEPAETRLVPVVTWLQEALPFTAPGRYIYFSREFLQMAMPEDAVALCFAHEIGHHRLGHVARYSGARGWLRRAPAGAALATILQIGDRVLFSAENESAADRWGLERCVAAGYDPARCLDLFRAMEKYALDHGDIDIVFGPDDDALAAAFVSALEGRDPDSTWSKLSRWTSRATSWLWTRRRGYMGLRARRDALRAAVR
jgi:hypothetical protein